MEGTNFSQYLNELQNKKKSLIAIAQKAAEFGWIPKNKSTDNKDKGVISLQEIIEKLENDTLTIGVIGQMKCGKSTFLNSFIFEDDILPAATTPMTAALSVITYGEKERVVAEFYTADEWAEQKQQAERSLDDACGSLDESKIKAAKELVAKAAKLGGSLNSYLGTTKEDSFSNLIEYVGADGKYVSITKAVTIYYPKEYLKGVEIVDTPGFNDPIVSREERTKEFLKKADVVLMMLYAGRPFDATDRDIIFKNVRQCGIGKVLVGINKYDIPFCNDEDEEQIKQYVKEEIKKACRECDDDTLVEILKDVEPIPLSAEMALLSELPMTKISASEAFDFAWKRHSSNFGISTQKEMHQWSHIDNLVNAVKELIDNEKSRILFTKPLNAIFAAGDSTKSSNDKELELVNNKVELLMTPDSEIEEKEEKLDKAHRRMSKKINGLGDDLDSEIQNIVRKGKNELEDCVDNTCNRMRSIVQNEWGRFSGIESIAPKLDTEIDKLVCRTLKRACDNLGTEGKRNIERCVNDFFADAEDILMRFIPNFDSRSFIKSINKEINLEIEDKDMFKMDNSDSDEDYGLLDFVGDFFDGASFGIFSGIGNFLSHNDQVRDCINTINEMNQEFDPEPYLENAFSNKDKVINTIKERFIKELIEPLQEQIKEVKEKIKNKEQEIKDSEAKREDLEGKKKLIENQISELSLMRSQLI